jgi:hypothetical protein
MMGNTVTTGELPAVHPLTIRKPVMTTRKMNNKPGVMAIVPNITGYLIIIWLNYVPVKCFFKKT